MLIPSVERRVVATATPATTNASATQTATTAQPNVLIVPRAPDGTLRLRGGPIEDRRVRWDQGVIDNEGMGKKKSKVCCIYHRPRAYDESSSEEDSSDESSDDSDDSGSCGGGHHNHHIHGKKTVRKNAYEKMPKPSSGLKRQT